MSMICELIVARVCFRCWLLCYWVRAAFRHECWIDKWKTTDLPLMLQCVFWTKLVVSLPSPNTLWLPNCTYKSQIVMPKIWTWTSFTHWEEDEYSCHNPHPGCTCWAMSFPLNSTVDQGVLCEFWIAPGTGLEFSPHCNYCLKKCPTLQ